METTSAALTAAAQLVHRFAGPGDYGIAYGSHAAGRASARSDLDLVLVTVDPLGEESLHALVAAVIAFHHEHDLALDTEVDHIMKVHATESDVDDATSLRCFSLLAETRIDLPAVVVEPWFLNSDTFRIRLLLNALSTPHVFLGGDLHRFEAHRRAAERAVALLAVAASECVNPSTDHLIRVLCEHRDGAVGEDFLGYTPGPQLFSVLRHGLARLDAEGLISTADGDCHQCDPVRVRAAIARSRDQVQRCGPVLG